MNNNQPPIGRNTLVSKPLLERLIKATCIHYDITEEELKNGTSQDQVEKKHICWYLIKDNVVISYERIGMRFNGERYSTVLRAVEKIQAHKNIYAHTLHDLRKISEIANTLA